MGCLSSKPEGGAPSTAKTNARAKPIPVERQQEAENHFGLKTHTVIRPLGTGGTGETYLCKRLDTGALEAVKVIKRPIPTILEKMIANEILIQAQLGEGHFNIVNAHEVLLTDSHLCLMLEFAQGGTLTDYVSERYSSVDERGGLFLNEDEARYLFRQCILAVEYCHRHNVAHRDLKLDNTLLDGSDPPYIKICDFGFAKLMGNDNLITKIGTPVYMSPELIKKSKGGYDGRATDVWACGVLLYVMLLGAFPFEQSSMSGGDEQRAFNEVHYEQIRVHWTENPRNKDIVRRMSDDCRDLLDKIFQLDGKKRITIPEIKQHPWYVEALSPRYQTAMDKLEERQRMIEADIGLSRESGKGLTEATIKELVALACSKSSEDHRLIGQEIMLKRNPTSTQLSTLMEDASIIPETERGSEAQA